MESFKKTCVVEMSFNNTTMNLFTIATRAETIYRFIDMILHIHFSTDGSMRRRLRRNVNCLFCTDLLVMLSGSL